ncbi:MAG TPA: hypothetical protein VME17_03650 [Bryobacteraceae bacterium]|nr:hypothetical protein [Bryobacteraceae bacterium]
MNAARLSPTTSGFALAAAVTVLFSTVVACVKDANAPFKAFMKSLTDHDWTTQGLADVLLFVTLGLIFTRLKVAPGHLTAILIASVVAASLGLGLWYALY